MFLLSCAYKESTMSLSEMADIAQVIIAIANILLALCAVYVFFYQKRKDIKTDNDTARLYEQNIKIQWFKELIIQPNLNAINSFYEKLHSIKDKINSNDLTIEQKEDLNNFIKAEQAVLRKSFVDVLFQVDKKFADLIMKNLDELIDNITNSIFDDELKLKHPATYEKHIGSRISYSKNNLIALIYNYKGL